MKTLLFSFAFLMLSMICSAQDTSVIRLINAQVTSFSEKAQANKYKLVEGNVLNSKNEENGIRFHLDGGGVEIIKTEDVAKKTAELFYLNKDGLIYYTTLANGDISQPSVSIYFHGNSA